MAAVLSSLYKVRTESAWVALALGVHKSVGKGMGKGDWAWEESIVRLSNRGEIAMRQIINMNQYCFILIAKGMRDSWPSSRLTPSEAPRCKEGAIG